MSWWNVWFSSSKVQKMRELVVMILKLFLGKVGQTLWDVAQEEVIKAEGMGDTPGAKKFELAYKGIKNRIKESDLPNWLLTIAIEASVGALKSKT